MANKERSVDLVVRARDQYSKVLANLKQQQQGIADAGRKSQLQFGISTRKEIAATQAEIKRLAHEFKALSSTQGASRAEIARVVVEKAKLQARAGELKAALRGVEQATHRLKVGQTSSLREFLRNTNALRSEASAANATAAALNKVQSASNGAASAQDRLARNAGKVQDAMGASGVMNRGGDRRGKRGENQEVEMYGLRPYQMVNLGYQMNDVLSGLAMGQPPMQIFAQQIGQIIQIWPQMMVGLVKGIPILASLGAAFAPLIAAMVRIRNQSESVRYFTSQLTFLADGGLYTARSLAGTTREIQKMGVAIGDARKLTLDFARMGMRQSDMVALVQMSRDLSNLTGESVVDIAQKLSKTFRGTVDDVRKLDEELKFLTASQLEQIRAMDRQGDRAGALRKAQDYLRQSLVESRREQTTWGAAVSDLGTAWDNLVTAFEKSGIIEVAAKGLDLLAHSARGAGIVLKEVSGIFSEPDLTLGEQYGRIRLQINQARKDLEEERQRNANLSPFVRKNFGSDDRITVLEGQLAALAAQEADIVAQIKAASAARQQVATAAEEEKKLQLDVGEILRSQSETMRQELDTAALTNRERYIEAALLEARNKALERARDLGLQFNGLTEDQTRMLREQAGLTFDRMESANFVSSGMGSLVDRIVGVESGGNPNAKNPMSTATGLGQFIKSTWLEMFRRYFPEQAATMSSEAILELRKDSAISRQMIELYARENAKILQSAGVAVNDAALYLAHFLGPRGAAGVLAARPGTPVSNVLGQDQIAANRSILEGKNTSQVIAWAQKKMGISQNELAITTELAQQEERRLENQREYAEAYRQRIASQQFEIQQASEMARQAAINKAIREEELTAQKAGLDLTAEQRAEIERTTGALFDRQNVESEVNRLTEQRTLLLERLNIAQQQGDASAVARAIEEVGQTEEELISAIEAAIAFWEAMGGPGADAAIMKLNNVRDALGDVVKEMETQFLPTAMSLNESLADVGGNAFSSMAEAIANGTNAFEAFFQTLKQGLGEFLIEIGKAIVKQALFNALSGGAAGGGGFGTKVSGLLTGLFHSGGMLGRSAGSGSRMVNPAIFAGAQRFHSGGMLGLGPNEVPFVGLKDEEILTRDDPRHVLNGGGSGGSVNVKSVNVFDPVDVLEAALATEAGEKVIINFMTRRSKMINGAIAT